jgi:hypothetical protein
MSVSPLDLPVNGKRTVITHRQDNSGEAVTFDSQVFSNGDDHNQYYMTHKITLQSYGRSAILELGHLELDAIIKHCEDLKSLKLRYNL